MKRTASSVLAAAALAVPLTVRADMSADQTPFNNHYGWWISRFDHNGSLGNINTMVNRADQIGITDIYFQVRGAADAWYYHNTDAGNNIIETWPTGKTWTNAGDPLQQVINLAHPKGIRVHAWVNMAPLWSGASESTNANHVVNREPRDANGDSLYWIRRGDGSEHGAVMPLNSSYVTVNPTRTDVQSHINNVIKNITENYDIDGVHMDYIRLLGNHFGSGSGGSNPINYPSDPETLGRFTAETGLAFNSVTNANRAAYKTWLSEQITKLVRDARTTTKTYRPDAQLTAAVWRDADIGLDEYQQDWNRWVDDGLLDAALPMIYFENSATYSSNVIEAVERRGNAAIIAGLGTYLQDDPTTAYNNVMSQLTTERDQGSNGFMVYNYGSLDFSSIATAQGKARLAITDFIAANGSSPVQNLATFETTEDTFTRSITFSGSNQNVASGSADRVTSQSHGGGGSQQIVINKSVGAGSFLARHVSGDGEQSMNVINASIGSIGLWLKTSTRDVQIAIGTDDPSTGDRGYLQNVIADSQWHKYEWFLNDTTQWDNWSGGNGQIGARYSLDAVHFVGTETTNTLFMDDVFFDAAAVAADQWRLDSNLTPEYATNWSMAGNWQGALPNAVGATANLLRRPTANQTINVDTPVTLGTLRFNNTSSYTLSGSAITLDAGSGNALIEVLNRGTHHINAPMTINDPTDVFVDRGSTLNLNGALSDGGNSQLTKTGNGTLNVGNVTTNALTVNVGTMNSSGGGNVAVNGEVVVNTGAALVVNGTLNADRLSGDGHWQINGTVNVNADSVADASRIASAAFAPGAKLNLNNNDLIVDGNYSDIEPFVKQGLNGGDWLGNGITSSAAANDTNFMTALGVVNNADIGRTEFAGQTDLDGDENLVKYTYYGDADLGGSVNLDDFNQFLFGYNNGNAGPAAIWLNGDFDYSGSVNLDDFNQFLFGLQNQNAPLVSPELFTALSEFARAEGIDVDLSSVPEPSTVTMLGLSSLMFSRLRRVR